jgi:hypothetical protein
MKLNVITDEMKLELFEKAYDHRELYNHYSGMADTCERAGEMAYAKEYEGIADSNHSALLALKEAFFVLEIHDEWLAYKAMRKVQG